MFKDYSCMVLEAGVNRALKYSHSLFLFITFCFKEWSSVFHTEHFIFTETTAVFFFFKKNEHLVALCHYFRPLSRLSALC